MPAEGDEQKPEKINLLNKRNTKEIIKIPIKEQGWLR